MTRAEYKSSSTRGCRGGRSGQTTRSHGPMTMINGASARAEFRELIESGTTLVVPGAPNALTARLIEDAGFAATYVTGAGIANTFLGVPDIGLLSLTELAAHVAAIDGAVSTPLIV